MRVSYSRTKTFYAAAGRYEGTDYGYDTVVPAVDALVAAGLLVDHDRVKGRPGGTGVQSSFRPAKELADIVLPKPRYQVGEIIRLKDANGALISYRDTERTTRDRRFLETVNGHIAEADIRLDHINGVQVDESVGTLRFPGFLQWLDEGFGDHTVYTRMKQLYRVYNGSWSLGGRFYGGWWQQPRAIDRKHLLIGGGETAELDYEMLHPRLLYAIAGQKLDGDAYTLDGWERKVCKRGFNILLNARSYPNALGAILPHVGDSRKAAIALIAAMKNRHSAIADAFHSGAGLRLQNLDADMAKLVMRDLTVHQGVTVLPVHDSFIVRKEHQARLEEAMDRAYSEVAGSVGIRRTASKGWPGIHLHREGASGAVKVQDGGIPAMPRSVRATSCCAMRGANRPNGAMENALEGGADPPPIIPRTITGARDGRPCSPPAFLDPANRNRVLAEELRRLAGRPLKDRPTMDRLGKPRHRTNETR